MYKHVKTYKVKHIYLYRDINELLRTREAKESLYDVQYHTSIPLLKTFSFVLKKNLTFSVLKKLISKETLHKKTAT